VSDTTILQIVSGFKPSTDGVGDFARLLGAALARDHGIRTHFLVFSKPPQLIDPAEIAPNAVSYAAAASVPAFRAELTGLLDRINFRSALLHYSSYGYSPTGNPLAFCSTMEELSRQLELHVFFHELYAEGPPWKRAFWTHREQLRSIALLQRIRKAAFTSNRMFADRLNNFPTAGSEPIRIPIFSNVGEPAEVRPLAERKRQMVIFGQLPTRRRLYRKKLILETLCRLLGVEKVIDVGKGEGLEVPDFIAGKPVERAGWKSDSQLSQLLAESFAGVIGYWPDVWAKSGVIAAYAAHAVLPIMVPLDVRAVPKDEFKPYVELEDLKSLQQSDGKIADAVLQEIAGRTHEYYQKHQSVRCCAETIASAICV
jgi:hypothetical protein